MEVTMSKKKIFVAFLLLAVWSFCFGKIWRVDNVSGNPGADFTSLTYAISSTTVQPGDTLYISPSPNNYGDITINKKLIIIGPGYFLDENTDLQANRNSSKIENLTFNTNANGSIIIGLTILTDNLLIQTSNINIKRCYIYGSDPSIIDIKEGVNNIYLSQNYIWNTSGDYGAIHIHDNTSNTVISNNFICAGNGTNYSDYAIKSASSGTNLLITQNVIYGKMELYNAVVFNNVHRAGTITGSANDIHHNIDSATDMNIVFIGTGTSDSKWQIKTNGPADGTGFDSQDIGMFGGSNPYVLSGIPPIPSIYYLEAPAVVNENFQVEIKIRSND